MYIIVQKVHSTVFMVAAAGLSSFYNRYDGKGDVCGR